MMFAVAQKRYLYLYDHSGMELHCLKQHTHVNALTFLPFHFLLVSAVSEAIYVRCTLTFLLTAPSITDHPCPLAHSHILYRMSMALYTTLTPPLGRWWQNTGYIWVPSSAWLRTRTMPSSILAITTVCGSPVLTVSLCHALVVWPY